MAPAVDPTSPRSSRPARNLFSPWSHVVRGEQEPSAAAAAAAAAAASAAPSSPSATPVPSFDPSERSPRKSSPDPPPPVQFESTDHAVDGNAAASAKRGKKPVWNVPSNGLTEGGAVMDAASWPALSESARASPKSSSSDSLKGLSDGSVSGHLGSVSPSSKAALGNPNPNLASSPSSSARYKSMKHGAVAAVSGSSDGGGEANAGQATPSSLPGSPQISQPVQDKPPSSDPSPKGLPNKNSSNNNHNWDHGAKAGGVSQHPHGGNDHHRGYGSGRRGNNGHHNSYGNRRDPDRGGYEWNNRNFVRDVHMQQFHQQWGVRPYPRPPQVAAQLIAPPPPPPRPFSNNMGFPDFSSAFYYVPPPPHPESLRAVPFTPHPVPAPSMMFFPPPDPQRAVLLKQIDYYFSPENLCKDTYLRQNMDDQGWVPISLIAGFNRVKQLTNNIQYIIDTVRLSSVVEVQGEKIRKRNDWATWVLNTANHFGSSSDPQSPTYDNLAAQFHNVGLDNASNHTSKRGSAHTEAVITRTASGNFNNQTSVVRDSEDVNSQFSIHSDWSGSTRSLVRNDTF